MGEVSSSPVSAILDEVYLSALDGADRTDSEPRSRVTCAATSVWGLQRWQQHVYLGVIGAIVAGLGGRRPAGRGLCRLGRSGGRGGFIRRGRLQDGDQKQN